MGHVQEPPERSSREVYQESCDPHGDFGPDNVLRDPYETIISKACMRMDRNNTLYPNGAGYHTPYCQCFSQEGEN